MKMNIQLLDFGKEPSRGSKEAAGWDLYSSNEKPLAIAAGETIKINTGVAVEIPSGYFGAVFARSGMATSRGLAPANKVGVVDSDYRGPIYVPLHNHSNEVQIIEPGERIAQLVIIPYQPVELNIVESLGTTARADGGFGSTGTK